MIFIFFILAPSFLYSVPDQEKFLQAVQSYNNAEISQAKELLSSLNNKSLSVNYNLGNCNFHLGEYAQAILNWRRAQKGASYRDYIELEKFISKASDKLKLNAKYGLSFKDHFLALIASWSTIFVQLILFLVWLLFLATLLLNFRFKKMALLLLLSLVVIFGYAYFCKLSNNQLIVLKPTKLVAGPSNDFFVIKNLQAGEQLELLEKKEIWYKVKTHEHKGWLHSQAVELV